MPRKGKKKRRSRKKSTLDAEIEEAEVILPDLSTGSLNRIFEGEEMTGAVIIQILGCFKLEDPENYHYQLLVSDGVTGSAFVLLSPKLNILVTNKDLEIFTVVKIDGCVCHEVQGYKIIILTNLVVLVPGAEVGKKIGNPIGSTAALPAAANATENVETKSFCNTVPKGIIGSPQQQVNGSTQTVHPIGLDRTSGVTLTSTASTIQACKDSMAASSKTESGSLEINVNSEITVQELKTQLSKKIHWKPQCIKILRGYPPKPLTEVSNNLKLKDIPSGETIIVEKLVLRSEDCSTSGTIINEVNLSKEISSRPANPTTSSNSIGGVYNDFLSRGIMMRHVVPSNNSCLFASVYFGLSNGNLNPEKTTELRKLIARVVAENPEKYTAAFLGMPNKDYCTWIQNADHWGGAIELSILSEDFRMEIVAVDTISLKMHRFGASFDYPNRIFLIHDGIHYDPLVLELESAQMQTIFPIDDDRPMEMAMEIAREAKSSKQYTDITNFTLSCMLCDLQLHGDKEARDHALATGHVQFGEIFK